MILPYLELLEKFKIFSCYHSGIQNTFKSPLSNGVTERLSNKIKPIKRITFSYRNFYNFKAFVYLQQGLISLKIKKYELYTF
ncbi:transposase [Enterococcus faecalis]|uniref:transposase n=1 Tax=Enterococcus TaxID=1350 RepID=UPI000B3D3AE0|nr:hypothetical protein ADH73_09815 [Enterococcus faecalis]EGO8197441.1 transposase [Enterococcus faecalis]MBG9436833.1 transposase [Enterococcus faecalis]MBG9439489.1 transposase [Enterococcus faecalis]MBG9442389.1 transposase [Enterococcus faecalis]